jgi:hypothetical protein
MFWRVIRGSVISHEAQRVGMSRTRAANIFWSVCRRFLGMHAYDEDEAGGVYYQVTLDEARKRVAIREADNVWRKRNADLISAVVQAQEQEALRARDRARVAHQIAVAKMLDGL